MYFAYNKNYLGTLVFPSANNLCHNSTNNALAIFTCDVLFVFGIVLYSWAVEMNTSPIYLSSAWKVKNVIFLVKIYRSLKQLGFDLS